MGGGCKVCSGQTDFEEKVGSKPRRRRERRRRILGRGERVDDTPKGERHEEALTLGFVAHSMMGQQGKRKQERRERRETEEMSEKPKKGA